MSRLAAALAVALALAPWVRADDRPDEAAMFSAAETSTTTTGAPAAAPAEPVAATPPVHEVAPENPLAIGGQLYWREAVTAHAHQTPRGWSNTAPLLADAWLDGRPNPRLRAMIVGRLAFDPTVTPSATSFFAPSLDGGPTAALDQAWIKFDVAHRAFITAGRQHVKWGASRFWNPNDLLHGARRDALAQFDARVGQTMLKVHVPWERYGWNFYGIQLLESLDHADTVGRTGGAARAEVVLGPAELGLDGLVQRGFRPRAGADLSSALGPFDVYGEGTVQYRTDRPLWRKAAVQPPVGSALESYTPEKVVGSVSGGLNWAFKFTDKDVMTVGAEYFYNPAGYTDKAIYPWLMFNGDFAPFYVARDYAAAYVFFSVPGTNGNHTITLSNLANLSDHTAIARLDWTATVVTHMRFEAYAAGSYGAPGGEFRFGLDTSPTAINGLPVPAFHLPAPVAEAGLALRVSF